MSIHSMLEGRDSVLIYDGLCPICRNYVSTLHFHISTGDIALLDARRHGDLVSELATLGFDINEGMVLIHRREIYFGPKAMGVVSALTTKSNYVNKINSFIFGKPALGAIVYSLLVAGRRALLYFLGRKQI
jgi:predicted DCC family thiol-disulfide oxidoreductase YuxK